MKNFAHLHLHTEYSLLDGAARIKDLFAACLKKGITAVALTDHGNMYGTLHFLNQAYILAEKYTAQNNLKELTYPVKPIIGSEFYMCEDMKKKDTVNNELFHIVLLAKNFIGYYNLIKLSSLSFTEGMYYKPRIDLKLLKEHSEGLICLTGCIAGYIPQMLLNSNKDKAYAHANELKKLFNDDLYIEIQNHNIEEELRVNPQLILLAKKLDIKLAATNDVHYIEKEDSEAQDVMMCVQMGKKLSDQDRLKFPNDEFYLKSYEEMEQVLSFCPESLINPSLIADKCDILKFDKKNKIPRFKLEDEADWNREDDVNEFFRKKCWNGLKTRYGELTQEIKERAEMELDVITQMGFAGYYLIVWEFINYARLNDIPVGPGRGSGVGSILAYALRITDVDPIKYQLIFERFLNMERISNPDFDIDFCYERREEVIKYVVEKYKKSNVAQIVTFGTMAAKMALRDVARVYDMPLKDVDTLAKMIDAPKASIDDILGNNSVKKELAINDFIDAYNKDPFTKKVIDMARKLEGMPRNTSVHAAGVVICDCPVSDYVPLCKNGEDITTQYDKKQVENQGLLKMDFLALKTLTDIKKTCNYIKDIYNIDIDFSKIGYEDKEAYALIGRGDTDGVFQLESIGMKKFMMDLKPDGFEDVVAGISIYRPGPMASIPEYIKNKRNPEKIDYYDERLIPILEVTKGIIIYQEQVMAIVRVLGGFSYGRADKLRKAMSDKKTEIILQEQDVFLYGCEKTAKGSEVIGAIKNGVDEKIAREIYGKMVKFGEYAFNKSHAAAYAVIAFQTAYLKAYYPIEFIAAVMNDRISFIDEISKYINYLSQMRTERLPSGVEIYLPSVNKSRSYFYPEGKGGIRFGLTALKGVGERAVESIIQEREKNGLYKSFDDFLNRTSSIGINKKMIESLIKGGAFDEFNHTRATLMCSYEGGMALAAKNNKSKESGQYSIFDVFNCKDADDSSMQYNICREYDIKEKLAYEKEVVGVYISGHPLDEYRELFSSLPCNLSIIKEEIEERLSSADSDSEDEGGADNKKDINYEKVTTIGGLLQKVERRYDKNGREMYRGVIEDLYYSAEFVIFSRAAERYKSLIYQDSVVQATGKVSYKGNISITIDKISEWKILEKKQSKTLYIKIEGHNDILYSQLVEILEAYQDDESDVIFAIFTNDIKSKVLKTNIKVRITNSLINELTGIVGKDNVKVK